MGWFNKKNLSDNKIKFNSDNYDNGNFKKNKIRWWHWIKKKNNMENNITFDSNKILIEAAEKKSVLEINNIKLKEKLFKCKTCLEWVNKKNEDLKKQNIDAIKMFEESIKNGSIIWLPNKIISENNQKISWLQQGINVKSNCENSDCEKLKAEITENYIKINNYDSVLNKKQINN
ncbi:hypothetical protein [Spiroplasma citri]|nr:hypothetical protein [Spiroplasma citri]QIA67516.1 hypothetical protein GMI18_07700 [Spiroplasma citri]QIA71226.1 hypothetical protein GL981_07650 [Spiroplasma citri]